MAAVWGRVFEGMRHRSALDTQGFRWFSTARPPAGRGPTPCTPPPGGSLDPVLWLCPLYLPSSALSPVGRLTGKGTPNANHPLVRRHLPTPPPNPPAPPPPSARTRLRRHQRARPRPPPHPANRQRHCRLWNFIAIDANAQKAAEDTPHVGYLVDGERVADPNTPRPALRLLQRSRLPGRGSPMRSSSSSASSAASSSGPSPTASAFPRNCGSSPPRAEARSTATASPAAGPLPPPAASPLTSARTKSSASRATPHEQVGPSARPKRAREWISPARSSSGPATRPTSTASPVDADRDRRRGPPLRHAGAPRRRRRKSSWPATAASPRRAAPSSSRRGQGGSVVGEAQ